MTALALPMLALQPAAGAGVPRTPNLSVQDSALCVHLDSSSSVRRVQTSSAFSSAIGALRRTLHASFPQEPQASVDHRLEEVCGSMRLVDNVLLDLGPIVYFAIGIAGEQQVVAFGVGEGGVVLLNPMEGGQLAVGLSKESGNRFATATQGTARRDELWAIAYACFLNNLARNMDPAARCQGEEEITVKLEGSSWTVSLRRLGAKVTLSRTGRLLAVNEPP